MYFFLYSQYVKGQRLLYPNSKVIIIKSGVKFNKNVLSHEPDSAYVSFSACDPDLEIVPSSYSLLDNTPSDSSLDTDSDDENIPPSTSQLPRWVGST